jgi:endonuclease YncB( thermonuclease family)
MRCLLGFLAAIPSALLALLFLALVAADRGIIPAFGVEASGIVSGVARVVDGDTLIVNGERIRLYGIDAPEKDQTCMVGVQIYPCGIVASAMLLHRISDSLVHCLISDTDRYKRLIGECTTNTGLNLNQWMVREGWAIAYVEYAKDFVPDQEFAATRRRGIWAGQFVPPARWRKGWR